MTEVFLEGNVENAALSRQHSALSSNQGITSPVLPLEYPMPDNPLWSEGAQATRLAELTAATADPAKELPLRRDVRSLGILLGRVLVEQEGEAFLEVVEQLRHLLIQHREQPPSTGTSKPELEADASLMSRAREIIRLASASSS